MSADTKVESSQAYYNKTQYMEQIHTLCASIQHRQQTHVEKVKDYIMLQCKTYHYVSQYNSLMVSSC